ncbi:DUF406 family protein [Shewanella sp. Isolate11]|uniref:DUF406 family protein n=1 Tax=Shewanella sp. Isolate11 TaxID=2908530 RepID=UPI001EFE1F57|nr:DUF406 family protein [Shewanella sp. Isolate11]MCG9696591.1 YfcZ/YiiS family protein [Shewanella sp. Isolate11]
MKSIKKAQSDLVNDTCNDCGSYADIGAVIDEHDTLLVIEKYGSEANAQIEALKQAAIVRFAEVKMQVEPIDNGLRLSLIFAFSAEKMIFQLHHNL